MAKRAFRVTRDENGNETLMDQFFYIDTNIRVENERKIGYTCDMDKRLLSQRNSNPFLYAENVWAHPAPWNLEDLVKKEMEKKHIALELYLFTKYDLKKISKILKSHGARKLTKKEVKNFKYNVFDLAV
jgi:hypothetical protein